MRHFRFKLEIVRVCTDVMIVKHKLGEYIHRYV